MAIENFKEIEEYFKEKAESEEVKGFLSNVEKKVLESDSIRSKLEDVKKATLEGYRSSDDFKNHLERVKEESLKEFKTKYKIEEPKDPFLADLMKQTEEMKKQLDAREREVKRERNKSSLLPKLKGFESLADVFISEDEEASKQKVDIFAEKVNEFVKAQVEATLKKGSYNPPNPNDRQIEEKGEEWFKNASLKERQEYMKELLKGEK